MIEGICHCKMCGMSAIYSSRKKFLTEKEKKALDFVCNDCMWLIWQTEWSKELKQLSLF